MYNQNYKKINREICIALKTESQLMIAQHLNKETNFSWKINIWWADIDSLDFRYRRTYRLIHIHGLRREYLSSFFKRGLITEGERKNFFGLRQVNVRENPFARWKISVPPFIPSVCQIGSTRLGVSGRRGRRTERDLLDLKEGKYILEEKVILCK